MARLSEGLPLPGKYCGLLNEYAAGYQTGIAYARARQDFDAAFQLLARAQELAISGASRACARSWIACAYKRRLRPVI